ncbi:MAG: hypothetical protein ISS53_05335 [Dehalococcoidia bacterium]|nr:hypothetical protein [Dehalococcoidia bacterium]
MKDLSDYSADFDPNLRFEDFSKDTLVELLELYSRLLVSLDGFWYLAVMQRIGNEVALECDKWAWEKVLGKYLVDDIAGILDVRGTDVADFMKLLQTRPMHFVIKEEIEVIDRNDALLTVTHCPTLAALEMEGEGRDASHCEMACSIMRRRHAQLFNPAIEVECLKIPPRKSKEDTFCQWEYKIG